MKSIKLASLSKRERYQLMTTAVIPRPIAWITTYDKAGRINAAPFSYFNCVSTVPPLVSVAVGYRTGGFKDTARNIRETGEFVVNAVPESLAEKMNLTATDFPPEISEIEVADLKTIDSDIVGPPRLADSPIQMECRLYRLIPIGEGSSDLILGEILLIHIADTIDIDENYRIDPRSIGLIGRLGGSYYAKTEGIFEMVRKKYTKS